VPVAGIGTETLTIQGVEALKEATHSVIPDRIETGTYAMAVAMTAGDVELLGGRLELIETAVASLRSAGVTLEKTERGLRVQRTNGALHGVDVMTEPYPGFPTDLQAQMMALMTRAEGASMITETVFEVADGILAQGFEPTPSYAACSICDYRIVCPAAEC